VTDRIAGRNPVREALRAGGRIRRVLIADGAHGVADIVEAARAAGVRVDRVPRSALDAVSEGVSHQGVVAEAESFAYRSWREGLAVAEQRGEPALLLAVDGVTDPRNLGSLLRTAEAAGCHAAIIPQRRAAQVNATVEKAAAGATAHLVIDSVPNLGRALEDAREAGLWIVALDPEGTDSLFGFPLLTEPVAIVVGAEGPGVSKLIKQRADARVSIPMSGKTASLNVGVAGALAIFETTRLRSL
jgi:23S rRNA (guanosine2251-2'-O)-methyltransferase